MDCDKAKRAALGRLTACLVAISTSGISSAHETQENDLVCAKPSALSQAENKQRKLDNYVEKSADPSKTCSGCSFFTPRAEAITCGKCAIFNGPANPQGRCDDWTPRPA